MTLKPPRAAQAFSVVFATIEDYATDMKAGLSDFCYAKALAAVLAAARVAPEPHVQDMVSLRLHRRK